ncbi:MAG TPA: substrate-binding domain-containing protein [Reyranella sp.]|nr:substrate-binding domain-containing protein [Reyranella sp.]
MMKPVLLALAMAMVAASARANEIQIIAGGGITGPMRTLAAEFEKATGHKLVIRFAATPDLIKMATGTPFDMAVVPREVFMNDAAKAMFVPGPTIDIARVGFGICVRSGAPKPDIATQAAFKKTLLEARSIAFLPESAAGAQVMRTFDKLGITDAMKSKTRPQKIPGDIPKAVAQGDAEFGIFLLNVLAAPGVDIVGPFPADLQQELVFTSSIAAKSDQTAIAKAFVDFLRTPAAVAVIKAQGMTPG